MVNIFLEKTYYISALERFKSKQHYYIYLLAFLLGTGLLAEAQVIPFAFWKRAGGVDCVGAGGVSVSGQCWFLGTQGDSCSTTCSGASGFSEVHSDVLHFAGSGGSNTNCTTVLDAFPVTGSGGVSTSGNSRGCQYRPSNGNRRRGTDATTYTSSNSNWRRACPCVANTDVTLTTTDWVDFDSTSTVETLLDIGTTVNLRLSAVNGTGSPTLEYRLNAASWVSFTTAAPANFSITNQDTLEFRVSGTSGDSATITVSNLSDSSVVDTVVGTVQPPTINMCGVFPSSSANTGSLFDSGGPSSNYSNNENCSFTIDHPGTFDLTFNSFSLESCCDSLQIRDAATNNLHQVLTGNSVPGPFLYTAPVILIFSSDFSDTRSGFDIDWGDAVADVTPDPVNWANFIGLSSNETISGINVPINLELSATNTIGSPSLAYGINLGSWNTLTAGTPVTVNIDNGDTMDFYSLSGSGEEAATITVTNLSDGNTVLDTMTATAGITMCGSYTSSNSASGKLFDSGGFNNYSNNENCEFTINRTSSYTITFESFSLEGCCDSLEIRDLATNNLLQTLTGNSTPGPFTYSVPVKLIFQSDFSVNRDGFRLRWE